MLTRNIGIPASTPKVERVVNPLLDLGVKWLTAGTLTTKRGKVKPILGGEPTQLFWTRWKNQVERLQITALGITLKKHSKGQWEVLLWVNRHTLPDASKVAETVGADIVALSVKCDEENVQRLEMTPL
jgi:hypothetical protein